MMTEKKGYVELMLKKIRASLPEGHKIIAHNLGGKDKEVVTVRMPNGKTYDITA